MTRVTGANWPLRALSIASSGVTTIACSPPLDIAEGGTLSRAGSRSPTLLAIGNFDGVHRGHVEVLSRAAREAATIGVMPIALTFDPPPAVVLGNKPPAALAPLERKIELIEAAAPGMRVVVKTFDLTVAESSPERFAREV